MRRFKGERRQGSKWTQKKGDESRKEEKKSWGNLQGVKTGTKPREETEGAPGEPREEDPEEGDWRDAWEH